MKAMTTCGELPVDLTAAYNLNKHHGILTGEEVVYAVNSAKLRHLDKTLQFIEVNFLEPTKSQLLQSCVDGKALLRKAEVLTFCLALNQTIVDIVVLPVFGIATDENVDDVSAIASKLIGTGDTLVIPDVQPGISPDEYVFVEVLCRSYQPLLDAIAARGLDPEGLRADAWCVGHTGPDCDPTERVCWPSLFYCGTKDEEKGDLIYARPIEGMEIRISLTHRKVIRFEDNSREKFPIPGSREGVSTQYVLPEDRRKDLKPIVISQPEGPSFVVTDKNTVTWQNWKFQVGFNSREGASLSGVTNSGRSILHKISFCEMVRKAF